MFRKLMVRREPIFVARMLALHKLSDVLSLGFISQVMGPPEQKMMAPLMLRNAAELEERELDTFPYEITNLGAPACITVGSQLVMLFRAGGNYIIVCLGIGRVRKGHVGVKWGFLLGRKCEAVADH